MLCTINMESLIWYLDQNPTVSPTSVPLLFLHCSHCTEVRDLWTLSNFTLCCLLYHPLIFTFVTFGLQLDLAKKDCIREGSPEVEGHLWSRQTWSCQPCDFIHQNRHIKLPFCLEYTVGVLYSAVGLLRTFFTECSTVSLYKMNYWKWTYYAWAKHPTQEGLCDKKYVSCKELFTLL